MAAQEHQPQLVVRDDVDQLVEILEDPAIETFGRLGPGAVDAVGGDVAVGAGRLPAEPVDRPVARGRRDPAARVRRHATHRPLLGGDRERLGHGLLGQVDVAEHADQRRRAAPRLAPEHDVELGAHQLTSSQPRWSSGSTCSVAWLMP